MAGVVPTALMLGHSFVKRLKRDLEAAFDPCAAHDFNLFGTASVSLYGVGGHTVLSLQTNDVHMVQDLAPDIVILEIGTNDFSHSSLEIVGLEIEDQVRLVRNCFSVHAVGVCQVIPCGVFSPHSTSFWHRAIVLNQYISVVLDNFPNAFYCFH